MANALLLIDLQQDFCSGGTLAVPGADEIIPIVNELMPQFDVVIASCDLHPANHISFAGNHGKQVGESLRLASGQLQTLWPRHCVNYSQGAELHCALQHQRINKRIYKGTDSNIDSYSAFFDNEHAKATELLNYLQQQQIDTIYVAGLATDYCVLYTVLDALQLKLQVYVIQDACRAVNLQLADGANALQRMHLAGAKLTTSQALREFA